MSKTHFWLNSEAYFNNSRKGLKVKRLKVWAFSLELTFGLILDFGQILDFVSGSGLWKI